MWSDKLSALHNWQSNTIGSERCNLLRELKLLNKNFWVSKKIWFLKIVLPKFCDNIPTNDELLVEFYERLV